MTMSPLHVGANRQSLNSNTTHLDRRLGFTLLARRDFSESGMTHPRTPAPKHLPSGLITIAVLLPANPNESLR